MTMSRHDLTHASFFSGAGGLDIGLERAGWRTVSFSEVDPYACAILAHRWPDVPNLGDILDLSREWARGGPRGDGGRYSTSRVEHRWSEDDGQGHPGRIPDATLWSGGFPCQDLSVAGKRAGFGIDYSLNPNDADALGLHGPDVEQQLRTRSGLAFAFLDLVERHRPSWVLLENVPGLLSSHSGRDLAALLDRLGDLGYGWAFRVLDARWFGVPQRRRRVFILAHHVDGHPDYLGPAEVLAVGTRCPRHPATGREEGEEPADRFADGTGGAGILPQSVNAKYAKGYSGPAGDEHHNLIVGTIRSGHHGYNGLDDLSRLVAGPTPDPGGMREAPGMAGWAHDRPVVNTLQPVGGGADDNDAQAGHLVIAAVDVAGSITTGPQQGWRIGAEEAADGQLVMGGSLDDDDLLPLGLDSHRYRVIGNGVASPVAAWIGQRLARYIEEHR